MKRIRQRLFEQAKLVAWLLDTKGQTVLLKGNYFYQISFVWSAAQVGQIAGGQSADRQVLSEESGNENCNGIVCPAEMVLSVMIMAEEKPTLDSKPF